VANPTTWSGKMQMAVVSNGRRAWDRTINLPQAFDTYDKRLAGPVSKYNREEEYPALDARPPISRHRRMMI
jgi:hypothetical protein